MERPSVRVWLGVLLSFISTMVAGCSDSAPAIWSLTWKPNPNPRAPLALTGQLTTDRPTCVRIVLDDGDRKATIDREQGYATDHQLLALGFRAATHYSVTVEVEDREGHTSVSEPWEWTTAPLPEGFPPVHITVSRPERMEPGVTLIPGMRWPGTDGMHRDYGALFALDERGDIVWFFEAPHAISEAKRMRSGNLIYYHGTQGNVVELDMLGNVVRQWHTTRIPNREPPEGAILVDASTIHHDLQELPSGNLLALSTELRRFESYPASEDDPLVPRSPARVIGDVIVEFQPDGTVVNRWSLLDILDPFRIGYESLDWGFWQHVYENLPEEPLRDWAHANSVEYDEQDHALIVSCYHQDAVFKLDLASGEIVWILGFPGWDQPWEEHVLSPVGDGLYPFHQHAARMTPQRTLLMFDNGKYRARPYEPKMPPEESFSRAVEYAIDEEAMEFRELWTYGGRPSEIFFTPFLGETDWLPQKSHVLITDGGRVRRADGSPGVHPAHGQKWARVFEVTHESPAEVVFEVVLDDPRWGWTVYRSERLPSLYPN